MLYLGVDLGGTGIKVGVVNVKGEVIAKDSCPTKRERPYQEIIKDIADLGKKVIAEAGATVDDIRSIGVGVPGICDPVTGVIPFCTNLGWHEVPFVEEMHKYFPKQSVIVDNDATVAGYAESIAGVSAGSKSSVFLTLGTGVGGCVIINGKPYSGAHGVGSEIGHMILKMDGELCTCGNRGCFERYASATALIREGRKAVDEHPDSLIMKKCGRNPERINAKTVIDAAKEGDIVAQEVFHAYAKAIAQGIVTIINAIDPEVFVLGGGVSMAGDFLLGAVRRELEKYVFYKTMPYAHVELAQLGADAGIIGAALLGRD